MECLYEANCNKSQCENSFCPRKYKLNELYRLANLTQAQLKRVPLFTDLDKPDFDPEQYAQMQKIIKNIKSFVDNGQNLYLFSNSCGVGKTILAIRAIKAYIEPLWAKSPLVCRALFVDVPTFLIKLKENIANPSQEVAELKKRIAEADLVVWDEIAAKTGSEYELNQLLCFINNRLNYGKANIYTSNCNQEMLYRSVGDRLASRIWNFSNRIEFFGYDKRDISKLKQNLIQNKETKETQC